MGCRGMLPSRRGSGGGASKRAAERWTLRVAPKDVALALQGIRFYQRVLQLPCQGKENVPP